MSIRWGGTRHAIRTLDASRWVTECGDEAPDGHAVVDASASIECVRCLSALVDKLLADRVRLLRLEGLYTELRRDIGRVVEGRELSMSVAGQSDSERLGP